MHVSNTTVLLASVALLAGCADLPGTSGSPQAAAEGADPESAVPENAGLWTHSSELAPTPVSVCFSPVRFTEGQVDANNFWYPTKWVTVAENDRDYVAFRDLAIPLLEQYERVPYARIDITGLGICADRSTGTSTGAVRIVVDLANNGGASFRRCVPTNPPQPYSFADRPTCDWDGGFSSSRENTIFIFANPHLANWDDAYSRTALVHEFGHALGFDHEGEREDHPLSQNWCDPVAPATSTLAGVITAYDPDSIMNGTYCHWRPELSRLDRLGLSIAYPASSSEPPVFGAAFWTNGGVVGLPGSGVQQRWLAEGAGPGAFASRPTWRIVTAVGTTTQRADGIAVPVGTNTISGSFTDWKQRARTIQSVQVVGDAPLYTAILNTILL